MRECLESFNGEVNVKGFYLLLHLITLRTLTLSVPSI